MRYFISYTLFYALIERTKPLKQSSIALFAIFSKYGLFWLGHMTSQQSNLWRHVNVRYWYCDVILTVVLACANWRKGYLHEWIRTVNIDFPPSGIHEREIKRILLHNQCIICFAITLNDLCHSSCFRWEVILPIYILLNKGLSKLADILDDISKSQFTDAYVRPPGINEFLLM